MKVPLPKFMRERLGGPLRPAPDEGSTPVGRDRRHSRLIGMVTVAAGLVAVAGAAAGLVAADNAQHGPGALDGHAQMTQVVRIGCAGALTGPLAAAGEDMLHGARMAIDDLNHRQVRVGSSPTVWELVADDDQGDPRQALIVARTFVDAHVNGVVGHASSSSTLAAVHVYATAGIPVVTPASTASLISTLGYSTFFRVLANDDAVAAPLATYVAQHAGWNRVAVIDDRTVYGQDIADAFVKQLKTHGLQVFDREYVSAGCSDFFPVLTRLRALRPEALFFGGSYGHAGMMLRQMRQLGFNPTVLGGDGLCVPELSKFAGVGAEKVICARSGAPLEATAEGRNWLQEYQRRFGSAPVQLYAPHAYDAVMILAQAMVNAGSADPARYLPHLRVLKYDGVTQRAIRFDAGGDLLTGPVTIVAYEQGRFRTLAVTVASSPGASRVRPQAPRR